MCIRDRIRECRELAEKYTVSTVFFGGGTPSILPGRTLAGILEELLCLLPAEPDVEITVECNPGTLTEEKLDSYRAAGVNRLSIGLQSADDRELKLLGRIHTFEEFLENYEPVSYTHLDVYKRQVIQENAEDIYAEAQQINEERAAAETAVEDEKETGAAQ